MRLLNPGKCYSLSRYLILLVVFLVLTACVPPTESASNSALISSQTEHFTAVPDRTLTPTPVIGLTATETQSTPVPKILPSNTPLPSPTPKQRVVLMAVGDIMLGRTIGELIESEGPDAPFVYTAETLNSADITVGNLESPISNRGVPEEKTYVFRAPIAAADSLVFAGFDLVNLANNHSLDYGSQALYDTLTVLAEKNIQTVGAGMNDMEAYEPVFLDVEGLRLAFLGYVDVFTGKYDYQTWEAGPDQPGVAWAHEDQVQRGVLAAKDEADVVIVLMHFGYEFAQQVSSQQRKIAHLAIDSGASLVIGSHPHVLQRIDHYKDGLIAYSMGNFVFDNFLFPPNYSAILVVELSPEGVVDFELIDVIIQLNGIPKIVPYRQE